MSFAFFADRPKFAFRAHLQSAQQPHSPGGAEITPGELAEAVEAYEEKLGTAHAGDLSQAERVGELQDVWQDTVVPRLYDAPSLKAFARSQRAAQPNHPTLNRLDVMLRQHGVPVRVHHDAHNHPTLKSVADYLSTSLDVDVDLRRRGAPITPAQAESIVSTVEQGINGGAIDCTLWEFFRDAVVGDNGFRFNASSHDQWQVIDRLFRGFRSHTADRGLIPTGGISPDVLRELVRARAYLNSQGHDDHGAFDNLDAAVQSYVDSLDIDGVKLAPADNNVGPIYNDAFARANAYARQRGFGSVTTYAKFRGPGPHPAAPDEEKRVLVLTTGAGGSREQIDLGGIVASVGDGLTVKNADALFAEMKTLIDAHFAQRTKPAQRRERQLRR